MAAIVTDQFRIQNANNFVESIDNPANSYYVFLGLPNPAPSTVGFGRSGADLAGYNSDIPDPRDTINHINHTEFTSKPTSQRSLKCCIGGSFSFIILCVPHR